jgi:hypothetical protein
VKLKTFFIRNYDKIKNKSLFINKLDDSLRLLELKRRRSRVGDVSFYPEHLQYGGVILSTHFKPYFKNNRYNSTLNVTSNAGNSRRRLFLYLTFLFIILFTSLINIAGVVDLIDLSLSGSQANPSKFVIENSLELQDTPFLRKRIFIKIILNRTNLIATKLFD